MTLQEMAANWLATVRRDIAEQEKKLEALREHERKCVEALNKNTTHEAQ